MHQEQPQAAGVDVAQAAVLLGITAQAVRKRVRRGTLSAYKVDGTWRIVLPAAQATAGQPAQDAGSAAARAEDVPPGYAALVQRLESEVAFLRQLTEHQAGIIASYAQQAQLAPPVDATALSGLAELPFFGAEATPSTTTTPPAAKRAWWRVW
jgi:hypothetical protein